jgi:uncharacterized membrane protein
MEIESYQNVIFIILTIVGVAFLLISVFLMRYPPKEINGFYGYRTSRSMQTIEAWDFSQQYSSKIMVIIGIVYTLLGVSSLFLPKLDDMLSALISIVVVLGGVFVMFYKTEKQLAKRFDD